MSAALAELHRRLVTQSVGASGYSTSTVNIFMDTIPETSRVAIVLLEGQGSEGTSHYGNDVPDLEVHRIEMLVRSTSPASGQTPVPTAARAAANLAYRALVSVANTTLAASTSATPQRYLTVDAPNGRPYLWERDPQGRMYFRCTFDAWRAST